MVWVFLKDLKREWKNVKKKNLDYASACQDSRYVKRSQKMPVAVGLQRKNNAEPKANWVQRHAGRGDGI